MRKYRLHQVKLPGQQGAELASECRWVSIWAWVLDPHALSLPRLLSLELIPLNRCLCTYLLNLREKLLLNLVFFSSFLFLFLPLPVFYVLNSFFGFFSHLTIENTPSSIPDSFWPRSKVFGQTSFWISVVSDIFFMGFLLWLLWHLRFLVLYSSILLSASGYLLVLVLTLTMVYLRHGSSQFLPDLPPPF